jgi:hypothetical protein
MIIVMRKLVILLFPILLVGCFTSKQIIEGKYGFNSTYGVVYEIDLHSDKTFFYKWQNGLNYGTITGVYEKQGKYLLLNGGTKPPDQKIRVEESLRDSNDSIYIEIMSFDNSPLSMAIVTLNAEQVLTTDMKGKVVVKKTADIKKIKIDYLSFDIPEYQVQNTYSNQFLIQAYTPLKQEIYFKNVKVRTKGRKLIMIDNPLSEGKPITLKKSN